jgi:anti-sigma B factor antagonist
MTIDIATSTRDGATVLTVSGDIDISTAPDLLAALAALDASAREVLVLDLSPVEFLDSSALGALVGAQKEAAATGGRLTVVCSKPKVLRIFAITRLSEVIDVVPSVDVALAGRD